MHKTLENYQEKIEAVLKKVMPVVQGPFATLLESMEYSVNAGGKRIRPILMLLAYEAVGGSGNIDAFLGAIEMIHTYSLIHDDLPSMDNDDFRRGKPTNHIVYGEATAILAGDALLNYAYECMMQDALESEDLSRLSAANVLANASGWRGMIGGQVLDMDNDNENITISDLDFIHMHKTGALLGAATKMGAILGHASPQEISALETYGKYIGKVFQIIDDVLDETSTREELGKPIKSDIKNCKKTYTHYYSIEECYEIAQELTVKAIRCLDYIEGDTYILQELAKHLVKRKC
ncbi:MAG: polyprenyl synthetase family protein [Cellulosilyticaceae bacterium]